MAHRIHLRSPMLLMPKEAHNILHHLFQLDTTQLLNGRSQAGQGTSGAGGAGTPTGAGGGGGSNGTDGNNSSGGGWGGGGPGYGGSFGQGAVLIIWGSGKSFPSNV